MARTKAAPAGSGSGENKKPGRLKQFAAVYRITARYDKLLPLWLAAAFVVGAAVSLGIGLLVGFGGVLGIVLSAIVSVLLGLVLALAVLTRRADRAIFAQVEGTPGATAMALQRLRRGWTTEQEPVAVDPRSKDLVFRAVGRPGIVLLVEGPLPRALRIAESERKRHARVATGVPVHVIHVGTGPDQTPLRKVSGRVVRLPRALRSQEVSVVVKRLAALGGLKAPVPKGIDPLRARADRRSMRGR